MSSYRIVTLLGGLLALAGCSGLDLLNLTVPRSGYSLHRDIAYGAGPRQRLDVYVPEGITAPAPVIVFFYGGSWQKGSKDGYRFVGQAFAAKGFVTVIADYRLYPSVSFPVFVEDGARAFAWTRAHIKDYGGDTSRLFLAGHSAGAYIAAMLAIEPHYLQRAGANVGDVKGFIGIAGPYDFLPFTDPKIKALFSTAPDAATQPITYVHAGVPPALLATGDADEQVSPRNSAHLAEKLRRYGNAVTERVYPGVSHIGIIRALAPAFRGKAPLLADIQAFVQGQK